MTSRERCKVAVRLAGLVIAVATFADTWHAAHNLFFNRIYFWLNVEWLWPFSSYDADALDDLGKLLRFAMAMVMMFFAGWVSRLVMGRIRVEGQCPKCGYDVKGVAGKCPECGEGLSAG